MKTDTRTDRKNNEITLNVGGYCLIVQVQKHLTQKKIIILHKSWQHAVILYHVFYLVDASLFHHLLNLYIQTFCQCMFSTSMDFRFARSF